MLNVDTLPLSSTSSPISLGISQPFYGWGASQRFEILLKISWNIGERRPKNITCFVPSYYQIEHKFWINFQTKSFG